MPESLLREMAAAALLSLSLTCLLFGQAREAPPEMFKDQDDASLRGALIIHGRQLFVDDHIIERLDGVEKVLNQPARHPGNPLITTDRPWEGRLGSGSVIFDREVGFYRMWYGAWSADHEKQVLCYATSPDGITWRKPVTSPSLPWRPLREHDNIVFGGTPGFGGACVFKDAGEPDAERRYKMLYGDRPDGAAAALSTNAACSPDGILWKPCDGNPLIRFSDSPCSCFRDPRRGRYVAYLRHGPADARSIARAESEDFVHWSPTITILRQGEWPFDRPGNIRPYRMVAMPCAGVYLGLVSTGQGEMIQPPAAGREAWTGSGDVELAFSRNGRTWLRVGRRGALPASALGAERATFIARGTHDPDWDRGAIQPFQAPVVIGGEMRIYYCGHAGPQGDDSATSGIGVATLRLDGFVSIDAVGEGVLTTRPLRFIGDTLEINADAEGGTIALEALDVDGNVIDGFARADCEPMTVDSVRHAVRWRGSDDCHLIQARPIRLKFYLAKARLYAFTPRIRRP